ncbi:hypothetical protein P7C70_g5161, partial [Phenoliferia sp. Uapishka_3]
MTKLDIIVYGVTAFTGQLVLRHLLSSATAAGTQWGVAGRSREKVQAALKAAGAPESTPVIVADSADAASIEAMVRQTKLVLSLVGPYTTYGEPLARTLASMASMVKSELTFDTLKAKLYSRVAVESRAVILHACGFDSVPSDLCAFLAVQQLKKVAGADVKVGRVTSAVSMKAYISGGTLSTMYTALDGPKESKKVGSNPFALSPIPGNHKAKPTILTSHTFAGKRTWGGFWMMSPYNEQIVRRSWGVLESSAPSSKVLSYGPDFTYAEFLKCSGPISAALTSFLMLSAFALLVLFPPLRWALQKYYLQPGEGPSEAQQKAGWVKMETVAKSVDGKHEVSAIMTGKGDPGYSLTAVMICESALALVRDSERLPPLATIGGPLTPATALGNVLVERLEATGKFSFTTEDGKRE